MKESEGGGGKMKFKQHYCVSCCAGSAYSVSLERLPLKPSSHAQEETTPSSHHFLQTHLLIREDTDELHVSLGLPLGDRVIERSEGGAIDLQLVLAKLLLCLGWEEGGEGGGREEGEVERGSPGTVWCHVH